MVIGESRFFSLEAPVGVDITPYTIRCDLYRDKVFVKTWIPVVTSTLIKVELQTNDLTIGNYEIRVVVKDPVDNFTEVIVDSFYLSK